jgi:hypothetical protein
LEKQRKKALIESNPSQKDISDTLENGNSGDYSGACECM